MTKRERIAIITRARAQAEAGRVEDARRDFALVGIEYLPAPHPVRR